MTGQHQLRLRRAQVDRDDGAGGEHPGVEVDHQPVGAGHDRGGLVTLGGVGPQRVAQLPHHRGGLHGVALHVADDEGDPVARQLQHVVPVAADPHAVGGGQVAGGGDQPLRARQRAGQQLLLQLGGQGALVVAQPGAGEGLGQQATHTDQQRALVRREVAGLVEADREAAERPARHGERQEGPGLLPGRLDQLRAARVLAVVRGPGRQEQGVAGPQHLGDGQVLVGAQHVEQLDRQLRVAGVAGQLEPVGLEQRHEHPGGAEGRQHHRRDDLDDVGEGVGLGEAGAVGEHGAGLVRPGQRPLALQLGRSGRGDVGGEEGQAVLVRHHPDLEPPVGLHDVLGEHVRVSRCAAASRTSGS